MIKISIVFRGCFINEIKLVLIKFIINIIIILLVNIVSINWVILICDSFVIILIVEDGVKGK